MHYFTKQILIVTSLLTTGVLLTWTGLELRYSGLSLVFFVLVLLSTVAARATEQILTRGNCNEKV